MADPIVTDVFTFVAVRSVQARAEAEGVSTASTLHDARTDSEEGQVQLAELARSVGSPAEAEQRLAQLPIADLARLAGAYPALAASAAAAEDPLVLDAVVPDAVASVLRDAPERGRLTRLAWDAVTLTYATGPDAGARLDLPVAALRVLAVGSAAASGRVDPDAARAALTARPALPTTVVPPPRPAQPAPGAADPVADPVVGRARIAGLVDELHTAASLLDSVRMAPSRPRRVRSDRQADVAAPADAGAAVDRRTAAVRQDVRISTAPTVEHVLSSMNEAQGQLLTRLGVVDAPLPAATMALEAQLDGLTQTLLLERGNPLLAEFSDELALVPGLGALLPYADPDAPKDPSTAKDVDVSGQIRPLGIGDLKVVKQHLLAYEPGEVAHVENVLKGESKSRVFRTLDRTETTLFTAEETTEERERDTQSTDRFELKKESESTIKEDMSVQAGVTVTGGFGPVTITAHGDFAYSTSKQQSERSSANFARDIVDRSISKLQKKVRTEQTTKTLRETEETDTHGIDNHDGTGHVTGVYRWVDKRYRAQVFNYGRRLMLEFVVPEPGAYFRASLVHGPQLPPGLTPPEPFVTQKGEPLTVADITPTNYKQLASRYFAGGITPPPPQWVYLATAFEQNEIQNGHTISKSVKDLVIPDGYTFQYYNAQVTLIWEYHPRFSLQVGESQDVIEAATDARRGVAVETGWAEDPGDWDNAKGALAVSVVGYDINAYAVNVSVNASRDPATYEKWQIDTFEKIATAYQAMKTDYDQKVTQALAQQQGAVVIEGDNPLLNRATERRELKKLCLTMLTGQHFNGQHAMTDPQDTPAKLPEIDVLQAMREGPVAQFFEQAFDWEQMTYLFYPYFWTRKTHWVGLSNIQDSDPLFAQFLQAGAARIVLPVDPAYNDAMLYFLQTKSPNVADRIWRGGDPPTIDDPLFVSIADEIKGQTDDLAGATPEGDPWEFTIPTTLVWLQADSTLPVFPA